MIMLIRGLPGSGKTFFAKQFVKDNPDYIHIESDSWFEHEIVENNNSRIVYNFIPAELTVAHLRCAILAEYYLKKGRNVIISNTFTTTAECAPYFVLAIKYSQEIQLKTMEGNYPSTHDVPDEIYEKMKERFEYDEKVYSIKDSASLLPFYFNPYKSYNFFNQAGDIIDAHA